MKSIAKSYEQAGVDINAGYRAVELMKSSVESTHIPGVLSGIGGFGGLFAPNLKGMEEPVFVSGTDGVGTKLKLAFLMDCHNTVGIDCVAMCVNDIICAGAKPLFFLDYIALGKNVPEKVASVVSGIADGCRQAGCALIGGETAEMPGFYPANEYDLAGFAVGIVDKKDILDKEQVQDGDVLIGLPSSGLHSNGFSLARKVLRVEETDLHVPLDELGGKTLGEALLAPTRIYVQPVMKLLASGLVKSMAHITGGGFYENLPRALPEGMVAKISLKAWHPPAIFELIAKQGNIPTDEMFSTFNMGIGLCMVVEPSKAYKAMELLNILGEKACLLGKVIKGDQGVQFCN